MCDDGEGAKEDGRTRVDKGAVVGGAIGGAVNGTAGGAAVGGAIGGAGNGQSGAPGGEAPGRLGGGALVAGGEALKEEASRGAARELDAVSLVALSGDGAPLVLSGEMEPRE
jgi:hypothetical protein